MSQPYQRQYARIIRDLIENPTKVGDSRIGKINSRFCEQIRIDLNKEFPLQDIKKIKPDNIIHELIWMIRGDTNIKYLIENGCHIWTDDSFRFYNEKYVPMGALPLSKEDFIEKTKKQDKFYYGNLYEYTYGDLGKIYSHQWRKFNGVIDQLQNCINTLKNNPDDRRIIVTAHNPSDIEDKNVGLPSCHNYFQFYTTELSILERKIICEKTLGLNMSDEDDEKIYLDRYNIPNRRLSTFVNIRSNDFGLGQPYNAAQYALLTHIIANIVGMSVGELVINSVDAHLYHEHFDGAKEWLNRYDKILIDNYVGDQRVEPDIYDLLGCKAELSINRKLSSIDDINAEDFTFGNYNPQGFIKMNLLT